MSDWIATDAQVIDLMQALVAPYRSRDELRLLAGLPAGHHDPIETLHNLCWETPELFEAAEARLVRGEEAAVARHLAERPDPIRRYRICQRISIAPSAIGPDLLVTLNIPVPRHMPPVQQVHAVQFDPPALEETWLPEAGLCLGVPIVVSELAPPPTLMIETEVSVSERDRFRLAEPDLVATEGAATPAAVIDWLAATSAGESAAIVDQMIDRIENELQSTVCCPMPLAWVIERGLGDVPRLTALLAAALGHAGYATRIGASQHLLLGDDATVTLRLPGSLGFHHRFLHWTDPRTARSGTVDLGYLERWGFAASEHNVRSEALRARLERVGQQARAIMRRGLYPGEQLIAGHAEPGWVDYMDSGERAPLSATVDTVIDVTRLG